MDTARTGRRTLLQRGLALLAGGVAIGSGGRTVRAEEAAPRKLEPPPQSNVSTLTFYARKRPIADLPRGAPTAHTQDSRTLASGELLEAPDGRTVGAFHTNCFCTATPLGRHNRAASNLEFQVLELQDGTLFGICGGTTADGAKAHAVVGGTGRYAAARGSYVERPMTGAAARRDVVELTVTLVG